MKTVGPLTDIDVIKLRPCEKKQVNLQMISDVPCVFDSSARFFDFVVGRLQG